MQPVYTPDGTNGETLLGAMDYSLLFAYAVGTYVRYVVVTGARPYSAG